MPPRARCHPARGRSARLSPWTFTRWMAAEPVADPLVTLRRRRSSASGSRTSFERTTPAFVDRFRSGVRMMIRKLVQLVGQQ